MLNPKAKYQTYVNAQSVTMFFVTGVDENTKFAPKTRMEIGVSFPFIMGLSRLYPMADVVKGDRVGQA